MSALPEFSVLDAFAVGIVLLGVLPVIVGAYQMLLASGHGLRNHYDRCVAYFPRTAVILPAWNEGNVIAASVDRLMRLDYPMDALRVYVVDDGSTDNTPDIARAKEREYPGRVVHLRRDTGGQGKAHTLNHGLAVALADAWTQSLLIMDADVIYLPASLRLMTMHLADPSVGAVTAYITEGSRPGNYMTRFVGFEYMAAQAAARRGQNVLGVLACLAGGAQLHSRENLEALGGQIDTSTLAEDTFMTFKTQLAGRRVLFEPHAVVLAEEPGSVAALWKQRVRWARGNVQITMRFRRVWFRRRRYGALGGISFGLIWFSVFLQPALMIGASAGLLTLLASNPALSSVAFRVLWIGVALTFVFITMMTLLIDPSTARRCWRQAITYPGLVSLAFITYALFTAPINRLAAMAGSALDFRFSQPQVLAILVFAYSWPALSMAVAAIAKVAELRPGGRFITPLIVYVVGYGPLLCAMSFAAYVKELRGAEMSWEKTQKSGKVMG